MRDGPGPTITPTALPGSGLHDIGVASTFDLAMRSCDSVTGSSMAMEFYLMPDWLRDVLRALHYFFNRRRYTRGLR